MLGRMWASAPTRFVRCRWFCADFCGRFVKRPYMDCVSQLTLCKSKALLGRMWASAPTRFVRCLWFVQIFLSLRHFFFEKCHLPRKSGGMWADVEVRPYAVYALNLTIADLAGEHLNRPYTRRKSIPPTKFSDAFIFLHKGNPCFNHLQCRFEFV